MRNRLTMGQKRKNSEQAPVRYGAPEIHQGDRHKRQKNNPTSTIITPSQELNDPLASELLDGSLAKNRLSKAERVREIMLLQAQLCNELESDPNLAQEYASAGGIDTLTASQSLGKVLESKRPLLFTFAKNSKSSLKPVLDMRVNHAFDLDTYLQSESRPLPAIPRILNPDLEKLAFTHRSSLSEQEYFHRPKDTPPPDYERLEYMGDAYIEVAATRFLNVRYPGVHVSKLAEMRDQIVKNKMLAQFTGLYGLEQRLRLGKEWWSRDARGADSSTTWVKILGDLFEAYVAAVVLSDEENGYAVVEKWLHALWRPRLPDAEVVVPADKMSKGELARKVLGKGIKLDYKDIGEPVPAKQGGGFIYTVAVIISGWGWIGQELGRGSDKSKQEAGSRAATAALGKPLTSQISMIKKEYDRLVAEERAREDGPREEVIKELDAQWKYRSAVDKVDVSVEVAGEKRRHKVEGSMGDLIMNGLKADRSRHQELRHTAVHK